MITEEQIKKIREELQTCKKPLIFFHDDADGLCSFLLLYRYVGEGKGIIIKTNPKVNEMFCRKVEEYNPDKVFIVDIALAEQEFLDRVKVPVIWIDHHNPQQMQKVKYFNPRIENSDDNVPVSYWCYKVVEEDLWISMTGVIADWYWPDFADEFKKKYPDLLPENVNDPETALFETELGKFIGIVSFALKGTTQQAMQCAKIFTRIKSPYEILNQETPAGRFIYKKYSKVNEEYKKLIKEALAVKSRGKIMLFEYTAGQISLTKDLANEMLHKNPKHIIIIAREKNGEMKMSIRSKTAILPPILENALKGVEGYGGGHEFACGANVKREDFETFLQSIEEQL